MSGSPSPQPVDTASIGASSHTFEELWQLSQGSAQSRQTQTIAEMEPTAAAALVGLHARGNEAAAVQVDRSPSPVPLASFGRTLSLHSAPQPTDAPSQSASPFGLSQGDPTETNGNGHQRARARPLPMPVEDEEKEAEESEFKQENDMQTRVAAASAPAAAVSAAAAIPRPQVSIALQIPSPVASRLPPRPSWAAASNPAETLLRGRNRAGQITTAQTATQVQRQQQPARPVAAAAAAAASPVPHSSGRARDQARYTPIPVAGSARSGHLCESNALMATDLWREYLAMTDPHVDSPISSILKQVAEQIDWTLDCLQTGLASRPKAEGAADAQQAQIGLDSLNDKEIHKLLAEWGPKQIHVVLKHSMDRVMSFSTQFARFLSLSPGRSYHELALTPSRETISAKSTCLPPLRPTARYRLPTGAKHATRLRERAVDLKMQGVENHQCMRRAIAQLIGDPAQALATNSALMTLRRAAYDTVHRAYFAADTNKPGYRVRVLHRLLPDGAVACTVNPHQALQQWTSFSGRVMGVTQVNRVRVDPESDRRGWFREMELGDLLDVPVQTVWVKMKPLCDAFTSDAQAWSGQSPLSSVSVEIEGEQVGQFARGDRVVGYGFVRASADFFVRMMAHPRVKDRPPTHAKDLDGPPANITIQANNLMHTNSQEWIESNAFDCANDLRVRFANVAEATHAIHCSPGARDWIITALIVDSVFRGEVHAAHYKLLRLQMLLSLVSGPGPLTDHDQEEHFHNDDEMEHQASLQGSQALQQWAMLKASLQRSQPLRDSDLQPLTMLILSGGPVSGTAVSQLVDCAARSASDCTGALSSVEAPLRPTRIFTQTEPLFHAREARDALRDEWTLLNVQSQAPLRSSDIGLIRSLMTPHQANSAATNGVGVRGRKKQQRTQQLTLELDSGHTIPPTRTSPSGPPHVWLSAPLSENPKDARGSLNKLEQLTNARLPLTQDEIEASGMFDLTAYHHGGEEEEKLCADSILKQSMSESFTPPRAASANASRPKPTGPFAAQIQGDPHWKDLHYWLTNPSNFRQYIAAARSSKLPRMTAEALALLQNYFNFAVNLTAKGGRVQEVYNAHFNDLARRVAVSHARLHLRRDVNVLDMTVGLMIAEEQAATVHSDVPRASHWNRAEMMFGAFSIESIPQGSKNYCAYTLATFNKLFNDISRDAAAHVHTPRSSRSNAPNPSATPAGISRAPSSSGIIHTDPMGIAHLSSPLHPQAAAPASGFDPSPIQFGYSPAASVAPESQSNGIRNQQPGASHFSQSASMRRLGDRDLYM